MSEAPSVMVFAIIDAPRAQRTVQRLPLTAKAQAAVEWMIAETRGSLCGDAMHRVQLEANFAPDEEHVFVISGFELPAYLSTALANPLDAVSLRSAESAKLKVRGLCYSLNDCLYFQCWRHYDLLGRKDRLFLNVMQSDFDLLDGQPFIVEKKLDAAYVDGDLLFKVFGNVSSMLGLASYVIAATEEDILTFASSELIDCDGPLLHATCNQLNRRKIKAILESGVLSTTTLDDLREAAAAAGYELRLSADKVHVPGAGKELGELLSFLSERMYCGPISGNPMLSTSTRRRN